MATRIMARGRAGRGTYIGTTRSRLLGWIVLRFSWEDVTKRPGVRDRHDRGRPSRPRGSSSSIELATFRWACESFGTWRTQWGTESSASATSSWPRASGSAASPSSSRGTRRRPAISRRRRWLGSIARGVGSTTRTPDPYARRTLVNLVRSAHRRKALRIRERQTVGDGVLRASASGRGVDATCRGPKTLSPGQASGRRLAFLRRPVPRPRSRSILDRPTRNHQIGSAPGAREAASAARRGSTQQ